MSGQQEPWGKLDRFDQLDPRDSTLDLSGLISRLNNGTQNNGSLSNGDNDRGNDDGVGLGNNTFESNSGVTSNGGVAGNSGVNGTGETVPYSGPPQRPPGANGHGALAAYGTHAARGTHATPRHSRDSTQARSLPEPGALPDPVTPTVRSERPVPGSLDDLRQRLERLPYGHPSSPYHVDGERKPPPPRLKHLELASPTPGRITQAHSQPPIVEDDPVAAPAPGPPNAAPIPGTEPDSSNSPGSAVLTQDQVRIADDAYDRFRAAEGRSLFGSYGSTGLTVVLRDVAAGLEHGELAPGTEQNSLLEPDAFKARFAAMLARYPDRTAELLARRIPGAISYSFMFDTERYSEGIWMVQDALTAMGFELLARRNDWNNTTNRCVATMWHDPTSGLPFEVQFHTTASLEAQQLARSSATLISDPHLPSAEAANLRSDLTTAWTALPAPPGLGQIGDYRRDGGSPPGSQQSGGQPPGGPPPASTASG